MEISFLLIKQIIALILMGFSGYVVRKSGLITHDTAKGITIATVYVFSPAALFYSFQTDITQEKLHGFLYAFIAASIVLGVYFLLMVFFKPVFKLNAIEADSIIYSNAGALIIPIVLGVFGQEYVFYTSAYLFVQNALLWTHAWITIGGVKEINWKKIILHPCILGILSGLLFFIMGWHLSGVADTAVSNLSNCMGPGCVVGIGIMLAEVDLKEMLKNARIWIVMVMRLLVYPTLAMFTAFLVWNFFPLEVEKNIYLIVLLSSTGPAATSLTQMAQIHDNDPGYASAINVLTTIGSIFTFPLIITIAQLL